MPASQHSIQKIHIQAFCTLIIVSILVCVSYFKLDISIAWVVNHYNLAYYRIFKYFIRFAELFVLAACFTLLGLILSSVKNPYYTPLKQKLLAISVGLMAACAIKDVLKYAFSRVGLYFFHGGFTYGSFPSGHTMIPFFVAAFLWHWKPCLRPVLFIIPLLVAIGLLATNSHFLGDIIGGGGLGIIAGSYAYYFSEISQLPKS